MTNMDKQTLINNALVYYYQFKELNQETFNLLDDSLKLKAIMGFIDERSDLEGYEYKWLIANHPEQLPTYFEFILDEIRELETTEIELLPYKYKIIWYDMLYQHFVENDCEYHWKNEGYDKELAEIKAKWRNDNIDSILND